VNMKCVSHKKFRRMK